MTKYRHRNCDRAFTPATFAYVLPPAHAFDEMIRKAESIINFGFGMTLLHEKDQYEKAVGREKATQDLHRGRKGFHLHHIKIAEHRVYFFLRTQDTYLPVEIIVSVDFELSKSRLESIEFYTLC